MQIKCELICHPATPARGVDRVYASVATCEAAPNKRMVEFHVHGDGSLRLPTPVNPQRADDLWRTTCFELFAKPLGARAYVEFNLAPSFAWAAYRFDSYRDAGGNLPLQFEPEIELSPTDGRIVSLYAELDLSALEGKEAALGLSAVIEETDGSKSYWALAHAPGPPDFHNPACFIATLPAPGRP